MGVNLLQGAPVVFWQTADAVLYMELVFAYHGGSALPEQFVIVEQAARNGVSMAQMPTTVGSRLMFSNTSSKVAQQMISICSPSKYWWAVMSWKDPSSP